VPGFHINGALTLGENIADIAGIEIAYKAYIASLDGRTPPTIDDMTADQRFYIGFAQSWLGKRSFYSAFAVVPGDKMYLQPEDRVTLW
jgi:putative endopeptidase